MKYPIFSLIILGLSLCSTEKKRLHGKLDSELYDDQSERIAIMEEEIKCFSKIKDAEFKLANANGFHNERQTLPGASSWLYEFVVKIDTADAFKWKDGMVKIEPDSNNTWMIKLTDKRKQNWRVSGKPTYYTRDNDHNVMMVEFYEDGIIFKRVIGN